MEDWIIMMKINTFEKVGRWGVFSFMVLSGMMMVAPVWAVEDDMGADNDCLYCAGLYDGGVGEAGQKQEIHRIITVDGNGVCHKDAHYACSNCIGNFDKCPACRKAITGLDKKFRTGKYDQWPLEFQKALLEGTQTKKRLKEILPGGQYAAWPMHCKKLILAGLDENVVKELAQKWNVRDIQQALQDGFTKPENSALIQSGWRLQDFRQRALGWSDAEIDAMRRGRHRALVGMQYYGRRLDHVIPLPESSAAFLGGCAAALIARRLAHYISNNIESRADKIVANSALFGSYAFMNIGLVRASMFFLSDRRTAPVMYREVGEVISFLLAGTFGGPLLARGFLKGAWSVYNGIKTVSS